MTFTALSALVGGEGFVQCNSAAAELSQQRWRGVLDKGGILFDAREFEAIGVCQPVLLLVLGEGLAVLDAAGVVGCERGQALGH
ncbi:MAG: hypothetical protein IPG56_05860 [Caulobacteraceae bacterium]|nr:hypothetical protein [Caulobacteraceae bacterium]